MAITSKLTHEIINKLRTNDNLFKLLRYDSPDALSRDNLTEDEKDEVIVGFEDKKNKKIHKSSFNDNIIEDERSEIRIYKDFLPSPQGYLSEIAFQIEIVVHRNIWELNGGKERADEILFELKKSLENKEIKSIGYLNFSYPVKHVHFGKDFNGYILMATTRIEW